MKDIKAAVAVTGGASGYGLASTTQRDAVTSAVVIDLREAHELGRLVRRAE